MEISYEDGSTSVAVYKNFRIERNLAGEFVLKVNLCYSVSAHVFLFYHCFIFVS